ncbi:MAG TPA: DoxX family membrane protein [Pseudobdellovibrionaceae bacterium]
MEHIELLFRWILGLQLAFWGLNGFFHWRPVSPSAKPINDFTEACIKSKFIMPTVKSFEVIFGIFLVAGFCTPLSLVALAPIIFVISGLHLFHNARPWPVITAITMPFLALVILNYENWRMFFQFTKYNL